jgi:predicted SAM-dependent methyltransferase
LKLDIGCGETKKGDIGLDFRKTSSVDIVADAHLLPFKSGVFDHVFSSEVIEHFGHKEVSSILLEWIRVLKEGGIFELECPDLRARAFLFFLAPNWKNVENIYGGQDYDTNYHKCGFSYKLLKSLLELSGIRDVRRIISGYKGIPFIPDCLHVKGIKKITS